jgi:hypothetical protein
MPAEKSALIGLCILAAGVLVGCASNRAPKGWLPDAEHAQVQSFGAWIQIECQIDSSEMEAEGEFIAAAEDTVFILTPDSLLAVAINQIMRARLYTYDAKQGELALGTIVGSLSTASHGWILIVSFPLWIVTGSISTVAQSWLPVEKLPPKSWHELRKFARFPQGLPNHLDRRRLKAKRW